MHRRISIPRWSILLLALALSACAGAPSPTAPPPPAAGSSPTLAPAPPAARPTVYFPANGWRTSSPEEQGMDSAAIDALLKYVQDQNINLHSLLVVRHGYLVTEVYFLPYSQDLKHPVYSITKSITSAMVGKAIAEGYIEGPQEKVVQFFPEIGTGSADPRVSELTLEHLLTMTAGYNTTTMPKLDGKDASFDTVQHILTYNSVLWPPGSKFYYDSGLPHVLSAIVQKATGKTLRNYAEEELFDPLAITDLTWSADPRGVTNGSTGLTLRPRDMAKIGYLYLNQGQWNGAAALPREWVQAATTKHVETKGLMNAAEDDGYGYLWWIDSWGGFSAHGFGGQYIFVIPRLDLVIVFTAGLPDPLFPTPNQLVKTYLLPAASSTEPLPPNPTAWRALQSRIDSIQAADSQAQPLPRIAREISGKTFRTVNSPPAGWADSWTLSFPGGATYTNSVEWPGGERTVATGSLTAGYQMNEVQFPDMPGDVHMPLRGRWANGTTFVEDYILDVNADVDTITLQYTFSGDQVTIEASTRMNGAAGRITAQLE